MSKTLSPCFLATSYGKKSISAKCGTSQGLRFQIDLLGPSDGDDLSRATLPADCCAGAMPGPTAAARATFMSHCTPEYWFRRAHRENFRSGHFCLFRQHRPTTDVAYGRADPLSM